MKIKEIFSGVYQSSGLKFINYLARKHTQHVEMGIVYGEHDRHKLDHYQAEGDANRPTIIFFYGGNWRSGERGDYRFVADTLLSQGYNVIIPDYRLYPLVRFSEIQGDVIAATEWAFKNVPVEQPIFIMGHSAGAQLGSLLSLNTSLLGVEAVKRLRGFIGLAGPYDFFPYSDGDHWDLFGPEPDYPKSQAVNYIRPDAPPLYLLHGETDTRVRRGNSKSLMEKMLAVGGLASREVYKGTGHVDIILGFTSLHRKKSPVIKDILSFLNQHTNTSIN